MASKQKRKVATHSLRVMSHLTGPTLVTIPGGLKRKIELQRQSKTILNPYE